MVVAAAALDCFQTWAENGKHNRLKGQEILYLKTSNLTADKFSLKHKKRIFATYSIADGLQLKTTQAIPIANDKRKQVWAYKEKVKCRCGTDSVNYRCNMNKTQSRRRHQQRT